MLNPTLFDIHPHELHSDIMRGYPQMAKDFPNQTACILIRNTSATDPDDHFPYNTKDFKDVPTNKYMFFRTPVSTVISYGDPKQNP
jgi:hypothetical protein